MKFTSARSASPPVLVGMFSASLLVIPMREMLAAAWMLKVRGSREAGRDDVVEGLYEVVLVVVLVV